MDVIRMQDFYEFVTVTRDGHLLEIVINRPQALNALHEPAHIELNQIFDAYFADPDLWVAIVTGAGTRAFCAGNDLLHTTVGETPSFSANGFAGLTSRALLPKPVIAAINGFALGGGLETALVCHLVVADQDAQLALSEVRVGLVAGAGGVVRLPRQMPPKVATEMILTGRRMGVTEAASYGLVNRIAPSGQALDVARKLAADIIAVSPTSVRLSLELMTQAAADPDEIRAVTTPNDVFDRLSKSEDMAEGLAAFAQKRSPRWLNR